MIVLDSSALLAFLLDEPGVEVVRPHLQAAVISTVALTEVLGRLDRGKLPAHPLLERIDRGGIEVAPFDRPQCEQAGRLIMPARPYSIGLGDCCVLALGVVRNLPILTGDRAWLQLQPIVPVPIRLIR